MNFIRLSALKLTGIAGTMKSFSFLLALLTPRTVRGVAAEAPHIILRPKGSPLPADLLGRSVARRCCLFVLFTLLSLAPLQRAAAQGNVVPVGRQPEPAVMVSIAENGRALMPIRVADNASPCVRQVAKTLADYLKRISGADFAIASGAAPLDLPSLGSPTVNVHPNSVVSIATNYIRGGYTLDQLLEGWSKKTKALGEEKAFAMRPHEVIFGHSHR